MAENSIKTRIETIHEGDKKQLEVIFSEEKRIIVEAPAGYGKTKILISKLAYMLSTNQIPNPKKILALTFSINAALKVKRDIINSLPQLITGTHNPLIVSSKINVSNYHGFCKQILCKYGCIVDPKLKKINELMAIGDEEIQKIDVIKDSIGDDDNLIIADINTVIKNAEDLNDELIEKYNNIIIKKILPHDIITHNSVLLLVYEILTKNPNIAEFYREYYPLIVIDEYQDTNICAIKLIGLLIDNKTKLLFLGDPLQRIYGFIGAIPNLMQDSIEKYQMKQIILEKNYRFRYNPEMLKLDKNLRLNAICIDNNAIIDQAKLPYAYYNTQYDEANWIANKAKELLVDKNKVAILVRNRSLGVDIIEDKLREYQLNYFYALFKDDDIEYINFHKLCIKEFYLYLSGTKVLSQPQLNKFYLSIYKQIDVKNKIQESLLKLLHAFVNNVLCDFKGLSNDDKKEYILGVFENRQLKQAMEYLDANIILSTIHGAKGLEWEYVIIADVEEYVQPSFSLCNYCKQKRFYYKTENYCKLKFSGTDNFMQKLFLDELCLFYVGITRAKKQAYISASCKRYNAKGQEMDTVISCFSLLNGIELINLEL